VSTLELSAQCVLLTNHRTIVVVYMVAGCASMGVLVVAESLGLTHLCDTRDNATRSGENVNKKLAAAATHGFIPGACGKCAAPQNATISQPQRSIDER
jgi:hypothetical protein